MKNPAGFLLIAVLVTAVAGVLGLFALNSGMYPGFRADITATELVVYLASQAVAVDLGSVVLVIILKRFQERLLAFLDSRWLPSTKPVEEDAEFKRQWYRTELGERHEMTKVETWWTGTFTKSLKPFFASIAAAIVFSAAVYALTPVPLSISVIFVFTVTVFCQTVGTIPAYLNAEWLRRNTLVIVFTHNVFFLRAHSGGLIGLLTGKSEDVTRDVTPMAMVKEVKASTDPRRITNPDKEYKDLRNTFYDLLGSSKRRRFDPFKRLALGVRTVFLPSFFKGASNTFLSIEWGETFLGILETLGRRSKEMKEYISEVGREADHILIGNRDDSDWQLAAVQERSIDFKAQRTAHLAPSYPVNLWSLKDNPGIWDTQTGAELLPQVSGATGRNYYIVDTSTVVVAAATVSVTSDRTEVDPDSEDFVPPFG